MSSFLLGRFFSIKTNIERFQSCRAKRALLLLNFFVLYNHLDCLSFQSAEQLKDNSMCGTFHNAEYMSGQKLFVLTL